jgi:hypothetical protein
MCIAAKFAEAEAQYVQALEGYRQQLGPDDPSALMCLGRVARSVYNQEGHEARALPLVSFIFIWSDCICCTLTS